MKEYTAFEPTIRFVGDVVEGIDVFSTVIFVYDCLSVDTGVFLGAE